MLFNSFEFAIFLPTVFIIYWFIVNRNLKLQNLFILIVSYIFYGWWDWRFLSLIAFSTVVDFICGLKIQNAKNDKIRKRFLWLSMGVNLGFLGVFKYFNFFSESFAEAFSGIGYTFDALTIDVILPVGISFYTFQTMSYTIYVYKKQLKATIDIIQFGAFVSFFPQLVAGPIERATNLLPQFERERKFEYDKAVDGMRQILWGFFKKVVIADNCAKMANHIFENYADLNGSTLLFGAIFFTFQIYGDFSGYSDIAIGTSKLFGFDLMTNFRTPYFSRDIAEFWRRWHISLSTWFRDYLYIPLGGSKGGTSMKIRNTFIIFLVSGFWHGANWTFIVWGGLNALYFLPIMLSNNNRKNLNVVAEGKLIPSIKELFQMGVTFVLTVIAWVFFRAENITHALNYIGKMFSNSLIQLNGRDFVGVPIYLHEILLLLMIFILIEWIGRESMYALQETGSKWHRFLRYSAYYIIMLLIYSYWGNEQQFIYFQF